MIRSLLEPSQINASSHTTAKPFRLHRKQAAAAAPFVELMTKTPAAAAPVSATAASAPSAAPAASNPAPAAATPSTTSASSGPSLSVLFNGSVTVPQAGAQPAASVLEPGFVPTLQSVFGPSPWLTTPTGHDVYGNSFNFNPIYFATEQTAQKVAQMMGGTVIQQNDILTSGPIGQNQPNYMVKLPNGNVINPGLVANFYTHGYPQSYIDRMLAAEAGQGVMS